MNRPTSRCPRRQSKQLESLERRWLMASSIASVDGVGNNLLHPLWGSTDQPLLRLAKATYGDGLSTPAGANRLSAREISTLLVSQGDVDILNDRHLSAFVYAWGQFIDHDIDLTSAGTSEEFDITIPTGDPYFDPLGTGTAMIPFTRSQYVAGTGVTGPRQQANDITAYIDGSMVYGSDAARMLALRTLSGGHLKTSDGNLLPYNTMGLDNATAGGDATSYFAAGDVRANENIELTSIQTLFVREHNRLADQIAAKNPGLDDEAIFQRARALVIGEIQSITFNEFLPALLGGNAISSYSGYKANVNPSIATEFSTAAFRFGHSMVGNDVEFLDNNGNDVRDDLSFAQAFFNPSVLPQTGIDPLLKYLASDTAQEIDSKIVDPLRNFLFGPPGAGGLDLASLNIQRGRDHGLASYNATRVAIGMRPVTSFSQITSDPTVQAELKAAYTSVDDIDLWVGGLAEDHVRGSSLGPTFQRIVADQFTRLRDGDRFWYQRSLNRSDLQMVQSTTLANIIARNSNTTNLQSNVFLFNTIVSGKVWNDNNADGQSQRAENGSANRRVDLLDADGAVVQSTTTRADGSYEFDDVGMGAYTVQVTLPTGFRSTTATSVDVVFTKGMRFDNVNFGQQPVNAQPTQPTQPRPWPTRPTRLTALAGLDSATDSLL